MFWRLAGLSTASRVESVLDRDEYTLEELLDEDEILQECKALNSRLINFLQAKPQVQQLLRYIIEEPPEGADNKRAFRFPFIACEIFTCEIDAIFKTLVEDDEFMPFLFSFLDPDRTHGTLLAGYFSKVVICLLLKETMSVMGFLQEHQEVLKNMVDLIGITSIMEVLIRLVAADDHLYTFHTDAPHWLSDTDLLELLVDKLSPLNSSEVHANAAETLSAVTRFAHSILASKLSSPRFVGRLLHHALDDSESKSTLVHSLSVCISLLDPKRAPRVAVGAAWGQQMSESLSTVNPKTVDCMLQRLGDFLSLLDVCTDEVLLTTYGELRPPFGIRRLKIVEFIAVLLRMDSEEARKELVRLGAIQTVLKLFFDYPFNNMLHHHVENIVTSCIASKSKMLIDHLFIDCDLVSRLLAADENPFIPSTQTKPTVPATGRTPPRKGNLGHLTSIANRLVQVANNNHELREHLQANLKWTEWQSTVLQSRNSVESVFHWTCGRPTAVQYRPIDSDEDEFRERDYDVSSMASNLTREVFGYGIFNNEDANEGHGAFEREDEEVFFDDESAEVVISSLKLGDEQDSSGRLEESFFTNSNWLPFQDDRSNQSKSTAFVSFASSRLENGKANTVSSSTSSNSNDGVVVGEDDASLDDSSSLAGFEAEFGNGPGQKRTVSGSRTKETGFNSIHDLVLELGKVGVSDNLLANNNMNNDILSTKLPDLVGWGKLAKTDGTTGRISFSSSNPVDVDMGGSVEKVVISNCFQEEQESSLPEQVSGCEMDITSTADLISESSPLHSQPDDKGTASTCTLQCMGVEFNGIAKALGHALPKCLIGESGPIQPRETVSQID